MSPNDRYSHAISLLAGSKIIMDSDGISVEGADRQPTLPVTVLAAFAIELLMKLVIELSTSKPKKGHNLRTLFDALGPSLQSELCSAYLRNNPAETVETLHEAITRHSNVFVDWRYAYESAVDLECSPAFLYSFAFELSTYAKQTFDLSITPNGWLRAAAS